MLIIVFLIYIYIYVCVKTNSTQMYTSQNWDPHKVAVCKKNGPKSASPTI